MDWLGMIVPMMVVSAQASAALPERASEQTLDGVKAIFFPIPGREVVSVRLIFLGGATLQPETLSGVERLTMELLTKGTRAFPKDELNRRLERTGSRVEVNSELDFSTIELLSARRHLPTTLPLLASMVSEPAFLAAEFKTERQRILQDLKAVQDQPSEFINYELSREFFKGSPYSSLAEGTVEAVSAIRRTDVLNHWRSLRNRNRWLLVAAGDFDPAEILRAFQPVFTALPSLPFSGIKRHSFLANPPFRVVVRKRELPTEYVMMRFPSPSPADTDYPATLLMVNILSDRLFEGVRTKHGLSYSIHAFARRFISNFGDIFFFSTEPSRVFPLVKAEMDRLKQTPLSEADLTKYKNTYLTTFYQNREKVTHLSQVLAGYEYLVGDWRRAFTFDEEIRRLKSTDVQSAARAHLGRFTVAYVGKKDAPPEPDLANLFATP